MRSRWAVFLVIHSNRYAMNNTLVVQIAEQLENILLLQLWLSGHLNSLSLLLLLTCEVWHHMTSYDITVSYVYCMFTSYFSQVWVAVWQAWLGRGSLRSTCPIRDRLLRLWPVREQFSSDIPRCETGIGFLYSRLGSDESSRNEMDLVTHRHQINRTSICHLININKCAIVQ